MHAERLCAARSHLHTYVVQDHTQRAHKCAIAVLDRNSGRGAAERNTFILLLLFQLFVS